MRDYDEKKMLDQINELYRDVVEADKAYERSTTRVMVAGAAWLVLTIVMFTLGENEIVPRPVVSLLYIPTLPIMFCILYADWRALKTLRAALDAYYTAVAIQETTPGGPPV